MEGWVDLGGWLYTEMVYLSADIHPSTWWPLDSDLTDPQLCDRMSNVMTIMPTSQLANDCWLLCLDAFDSGGNFSGRPNRTRLTNILMHLRKCVAHPYLFDGMFASQTYSYICCTDYLYTM